MASLQSRLADSDTEKNGLSKTIAELTAQQLELRAVVNDKDAKTTALESEKAEVAARLKELEAGHESVKAQVSSQFSEDVQSLMKTSLPVCGRRRQGNRPPGRERVTCCKNTRVGGTCVRRRREG